MKIARFSWNKVAGVAMLIIATAFAVFSFAGMGQERPSGISLRDRWFAEHDRCMALTDQQEQDTCWTNHLNELLKFPEEYKAYRDERKKRAWDAGELNNWEDDPCKSNYYGEFSMNDMQSLDPKESADLMECSAKQMLEDSQTENGK